MNDQIEQLFAMALGLAKPWTISKIDFSAEAHQLDLWVDFPSGSRFPCPECGQDCGVYDRAERTWRHLNFFQHKTFLHARRPRVQCPDHGVKTAEVPWGRPGAGFTLLMEAFIMMLVQGGMNVAQAAALIGEHDTRVWRVLQHYVEKARAEADHSQVKIIGVDETSRRRGHNYITVFTELKEDEETRVLYVAEGKDADTVRAFREDLEAHGGEAGQIEEACLDMSQAFINGLQTEFEEVSLTFDTFHVMQLLGKAVDEVRREEQKTHPGLKGTRYIWLKNEWNRTEEQKETFDALRKDHLATMRATHIKEVFQDAYSFADSDKAETFLEHWYFWATHSRIAPIIKAAKTIKRNWEGVVRWFTSRITNGPVEAINGLIQSAKRKARGFRSARYLITMVYLLGGRFDFKLPALGAATHTK